ncbi:hypothetical protein JYG23_04415 [Sedimentibacter sp. zth1]|uniref:hypothetical protein n=1 Tax=Sedimentibacter sp. zth1 TaxID=2816908 RepID=UPI001A918DA0|nr:hypothetical protein [Sedimentibacter sp. zth1]QSX06703.1 hypothetical protein JYG23_04415 [Sedimentibacter sp. zth1]
MRCKMKKGIIIRFLLILLAIFLGCIYNKINIFDESSNDIDFNDSLYKFDEFRDGDYVVDTTSNID